MRPATGCPLSAAQLAQFVLLKSGMTTSGCAPFFNPSDPRAYFFGRYFATHPAGTKRSRTAMYDDREGISQFCRDLCRRSVPEEPITLIVDETPLTGFNLWIAVAKPAFQPPVIVNAWTTEKASDCEVFQEFVRDSLAAIGRSCGKCSDATSNVGALSIMADGASYIKKGMELLCAEGDADLGPARALIHARYIAANPGLLPDGALAPEADLLRLSRLQRHHCFAHVLHRMSLAIVNAMGNKKVLSILTASSKRKDIIPFIRAVEKSPSSMSMCTTRWGDAYLVLDALSAVSSLIQEEETVANFFNGLITDASAYSFHDNVVSSIKLTAFMLQPIFCAIKALQDDNISATKVIERLDAVMTIICPDLGRSALRMGRIRDIGRLPFVPGKLLEDALPDHLVPESSVVSDYYLPVASDLDVDLSPFEDAIHSACCAALATFRDTEATYNFLMHRRIFEPEARPIVRREFVKDCPIMYSPISGICPPGSSLFVGKSALFETLDEAHRDGLSSQEFWSQDPSDLHGLDDREMRYIRSLFCVLPSSASVERAFSKHKRLLLRSSLTSINQKFSTDSAWISNVSIATVAKHTNIPLHVREYLQSHEDLFQDSATGSKRPRTVSEEE